MPYLTIEEVRNSNIDSFKGLDDEFLSSKLKQLSRLIDEYCNTSFKPTNDSWNTDLKRIVKVRKRPLLSVEEVKVKGKKLEENTDYYVYEDKDLVDFDDISHYKKRKKALTIDYTYGYEEVPALVKEVLLELLKDSVERSNIKSYVKSEQWEDYQYTLSEKDDYFYTTLSLLDRYKEEDLIETRTNKVNAMLL